MTKFEKLELEATTKEINVLTNYRFSSKRIKGLYCNGTIALNKELDTDTEKSCILAEELGHFHTSIGDIIDQSNIGNIKQEHRARVWAYENIIGLPGIVSALNNHCSSLLEMAEFLEVTEEFLTDALAYYKAKYGLYATVDNYTIFFEPLCVLELYK